MKQPGDDTLVGDCKEGDEGALRELKERKDFPRWHPGFANAVDR